MSDQLGPCVSRRRFVLGVSSGIALAGLPLRRALAAPRVLDAHSVHNGPVELRGRHFDLAAAYKKVNFTGKPCLATTINDGLPAPVLRWKQGETVSLTVSNHLAQDTSIHWHGMVLPSNMDGVPGLSFAGIKPGDRFTYQFMVRQHGTYWYHSHSGYQDQTGLYGAIIIDPIDPEPFSYDRDYVVMLSDWSDESPEHIYSTLKKMGHYYNTDERTIADVWRDIRGKGVAATWSERSMWNDMRMSDRDIADVTGYTYTYLMNGHPPAEGWLGLFKKGEKVRLRFINAAAMTFFDVRIPGLKMTVVAADGQYIDPVTVDEFRMGVAETYDVIVTPESDIPYTVFAQSMDRSGYARGTLTPDLGLRGEVPGMDHRPVLTMADMGMAHGAGTEHSGHDMAGMNHGVSAAMARMGTGKAGFGSNMAINHPATESGPQVDMRSVQPRYKLDDPGIGLRDHMQRYGRKVLTYYDLCNYYPTLDRREPSREIQLHLTGNMNRYMWSIDGVAHSEADPIHLSYGERVRFTLVNDTMMNHPMHLHGLWSELETADNQYIPRKHTVIVQPGSKISYLVTADSKGRWAYHCHLLYHMMGMMREVRVS